MQPSAKLTKFVIVLACLGLLLSALPAATVLAGRDTISVFKDIFPGADSSNAGKLTKFNDMLFFIADDGVNGFNPWISDGTPGGTHLLKTISTAEGLLRAGSYGNITTTDSHLFFQIAPVAGYFYPDIPQLWKTDGTDAGTTQITISPATVRALKAHGDDLYILHGGSGRVVLSVYRENAVEAIKVFEDLDDPDGYSYAFTSRPVMLNNNLYFVLWLGAENQLWRSDGTSAGTVMVGSASDTGFVPGGNLVSANNRLFMIVDGKIYQSSGEVGNFEMIAGDYSISPHTTAFVSNGSAVFFASAQDYITNTSDLFTVSDKDSGVQRLAEDVNTYLMPINGKVYFYSLAGGTQSHLGVSDGTPPGTKIFSPASGDYKAIAEQVVEVDGKPYFLGKNLAGETELWMSSGSPDDMVSLAYFTPAEALPNSSYLTVFGNGLFFAGDDGAHGYELMRYQLTAPPPADILTFIPIIRR